MVILGVTRQEDVFLDHDQMYVPGELSDVDTVLVDIGTGYYVDMVSVGAPGHFFFFVFFVMLICYWTS